MLADGAVAGDLDFEAGGACGLNDFANGKSDEGRDLDLLAVWEQYGGGLLACRLGLRRWGSGGGLRGGGELGGGRGGGSGRGGGGAGRS